MVFRRGNVVLIPFPYTDLSATKTRPAVVIAFQVSRTCQVRLTSRLPPGVLDAHRAFFCV